MEQERRVRRKGRVLQQATALFDGAEIIAVRSADDGLIYASLPHLCRAMGLDVENQTERIDEHAVLTEGLCDFDLAVSGRVLTTPCLKTNLMPLWLTLVSVKRLKQERQERILRFQRQAADVLDRLFGPGLPAPAATSTLVQDEPVYAEGLAIARLASEQAALDGKVTAIDEKVTTLQDRVMALEARLMPRAQISEEQAHYIADLVKQAAIALALKLGGDEKNKYFGAVYGMLYKRYRITKYTLLTQAQYTDAVMWLEKMIADNQ